MKKLSLIFISFIAMLFALLTIAKPVDTNSLGYLEGFYKGAGVNFLYDSRQAHFDSTTEVYLYSRNPAFARNLFADHAKIKEI